MDDDLFSPNKVKKMLAYFFEDVHIKLHWLHHIDPILMKMDIVYQIPFTIKKIFNKLH